MATLRRRHLLLDPLASELGTNPSTLTPEGVHTGRVDRDERIKAIARELDIVAQRLLFQKFDRQELLLKVPQLADSVARSLPEEWKSDPHTALELVLRQGASLVSGSFGTLSNQLAIIYLFNLDGAPDFPEVKKLTAADVDGVKEKWDKKYDYLRRQLAEKAKILPSDIQGEVRTLREALASV